MFHWDAAWGWEWSTYFAGALGAVIGDMALRPTASLLQAHHPPPSAAKNVTAPPVHDSVPSAKRKAISLSGSVDASIITEAHSDDMIKQDIVEQEIPLKMARTASGDDTVDIDGKH